MTELARRELLGQLAQIQSLAAIELQAGAGRAAALALQITGQLQNTLRRRQQQLAAAGIGGTGHIQARTCRHLHITTAAAGIDAATCGGDGLTIQGLGEALDRAGRSSRKHQLLAGAQIQLARGQVNLAALQQFTAAQGQSPACAGLLGRRRSA